MGLFDNIDWSDPSTQAQMAFAANLMSSNKGLFPAAGDALKTAQPAAAQAQQYKAGQINIADNISKLQAWAAKTNHYRRQNNMPDLTLNDLIKGNYSLLPTAGQTAGVAPGAASTQVLAPSSATATTGQPDPAASPSPNAAPAGPAGVLPASNNSLLGIDPSKILPALQTTESGNNPNAVSPVGAGGLMQLMPATAADPGFGIAPAKDASPAENQRVGDQYFQALEKKYGNAAHALVAYNWGPGNTDKWLKAGGDPAKIPQETQGEIAKVALRMAQGGSATPTNAHANDPSAAGMSPSMVASGPAAPAQAPQSSVPSDLGLYDPDEALKIAESQKTTMSPDQIKAAGLPEGTVAQVSPTTGAIDVVNKPDWMSDREFDQQRTLAGLKTGVDGPVNKDAISNDVWIWLKSGGTIQPQYGMGASGAALRRSFDDAKASIMQQNGITPEDVVTGRAMMKANTHALQNTTQMRAATEAYENTMLQNIGLAKKLIAQGGAGGQAPVVNRWIRYVKGDYAGDPQVTTLNTAIATVKNEYAKIQSGSLGNAPVTDSARGEADQYVNPNMSIPQILQGFDYMQKEAENRRGSLRSEEASLRSGLSGHSDVPVLPNAAPNINTAPADKKTDDLLKKYGVTK